MEMITKIAGYCGSISAIIALIVLVVKPLRNKFITWINKTSDKDNINQKIDKLTILVEKLAEQNEKQNEKLALQSESIMVDLRNSILIIYNERMARGYMTEWQLMNLGSLYSQYKKHGGNSYITECVNRLKELPVKSEYNDWKD